jgi:hypothetical protein
LRVVVEGLAERDADRERGEHGQDGQQKAAPVSAASRLLSTLAHGLKSIAPRA